jgi:sulfur carrier protein
VSKADIPASIDFKGAERGRYAARYASGTIGHGITPAAEAAQDKAVASVMIILNGAPRDIAAGTTLDDLLGALGVRRDGTAVALNDDVVPRARHCDTQLREGDRLEIIVAVAGG